jgi:hypothetical protein
MLGILQLVTLHGSTSYFFNSIFFIGNRHLNCFLCINITTGDSDQYCTICGLPFRKIEDHEKTTTWLLNAHLKGFGETATLISKEDYGEFELKGKLPHLLKQKLSETECLDNDKIFPFGLLEKYKDCYLCHRNDMTKVKKDRAYLEEFQEQWFDDEGFLANQSLRYLLNEPKSTKPPKKETLPQKVKKSPKKSQNDKKPSIEKITIKNLHDICDKLGIEKRRLIINDIKSFVCHPI